MGGLEYYLPLFFDETASFFDYLPVSDNNRITIERGYKGYLKDRWQAIQTRYARVANMGGSQPLPPEVIYYQYSEWLTFLPPSASAGSPNSKLKRMVQ